MAKVKKLKKKPDVKKAGIYGLPVRMKRKYGKAEDKKMMKKNSKTSY